MFNEMECNISENNSKLANQKRLRTGAHVYTMSQSMKMPILVNTIRNNFIFTAHHRRFFRIPTQICPRFSVSILRNNLNFLSAILVFTCVINSVHSNANHTSFKLNKAISNLTRKSDDPINVYRDKLGLFSHSGAWESTEGYDPAFIFSDVVNVSPSDHLVNRTSSPRAGTEAPLVSSESSCVSDCPLALPLVASAEQSGFRPNVLPKWSTIMANRQRSNPKTRESNKNKPQVKEEDPLESSATAQWRIFKYVNHPDELVSLNSGNSTSSAPVGGQSFNETMLSSYEEYKMLSNISSSEEERFFNESLTSTERSLIRNHYFGESKDSSNTKNETQKTSGNDTLALDAFRPRRSPYRPHWRQDKLYTHREALYQMAPPSPNLHPPPPGLAVVQSVVLPPMGPQRPLPGSHYVPKPAPPPATMHSQSSLPVRSVQGFNHHGQLRTPINNMNGGESPEESPSFRLPNFHHPFAKPKPMKMNRPDGRNLPPGQRRPHPPGRGGRRPPPRGRPGGNGPVPSVMSPPRPRPIPVPRPGSRPSQGQQGPVRIPASSGGGHGPMHGPHASPLRSPPGPPPIQYTYPKNAENIQDILTYFNAADNEIPGTAGKSNPDQSSPSSGLDAFSNELKEIHGSLLKDIREFAKRPSLLDADAAREQSSKSNSNSIPVPRPSMQSLIDEDDDDEPLRTKPKPVRELVNYRERERDDDREDERERSRDRHREKEEEDTYSSYDSPKGGYESKGKRNRKPTYSTSTYKPEDKRHHRDEEEEEADISEDEERNRRPSSKPRHRIPDREETYSKSRPSSYDDRPTYAPPTKYSRPDESDERLRPSQNYIQFVQDSRERHRLQQERIRTSGRTKPHRPKSHKSKSKSSKSRRHKYHHQQSDGSQNYNRYPSRDDGFRHRHRQTSEPAPPSHTKPLDAMDIAYYKQRNRPVVIKRPYQPYRPVNIQKLEKERQKQDEYWNSVSTINLNKARDNAKEQSRKQAIQNHYHYYGVNPTASPSPPPAYEDRKRQAAYTPTMLTSNSSPEEEDVLEIHTGRPASSIPMTTPAYPFPDFDPERDRKAKLQKMYMEYLQRKLEAQAEAQADAMLTSTPPVYPQQPSTSTHKPKRPMRMKIHIYPNEQVQVVDQNNRAIYRSTPVTPRYVPSVQRPYVPSSAYTNNYYHQRPTQNTYSSKPYTPSSYLNSYSNYRNPHHRSSQVSPDTVHVGNGRNFSPPPNNPADKNRNVVLHLHVHRRNGVDTDPETGMMMAGSDHTISTAKPLTYDEIYANSGNDNANVQGMLPLDEHFDKGHPGQSSNRNSNSGENGQRKLLEAVDTDKSISMELPIHQDKVEDVLSTLLKLRE